jgi:hypothetical protein
MGQFRACFPTLVSAQTCSILNTNNRPVEITITMIVKLAAVVYMTPVFVLPGLGIGALGSWLGNIYIKAQLSVKREMSNARSPVFSHFNAAIAGLRKLQLRFTGIELNVVQRLFVLMAPRTPSALSQ